MGQQLMKIAGAIKRWSHQPLAFGSLSGAATAVLLVIFWIVMQPAAQGWAWIPGFLLVAFAVWAGYQYAVQKNRLAGMQSNNSSEDKFLTVRQNEEKLRKFIDRFDKFTIALDRDLQVTYWNPKSAMHLETAAEKVLGESLAALIPGELAAQLESLCSEALRLQQMQSRLVEWPGEGIRQTFQFTAFPSLDGVSVVMDDISEREVVWKNTQAAAEKYRTLFDEASDAIFLYDPGQGKIEDINTRMSAMWGYDRDHILQLSISELLVFDSRFSVQALRRKMMKTLSEGPQLFESLAKDASGGLFWIEVNFSHVVPNGQSRLLGVVRNITDRKRTAGELNSLATKLSVIGRSARNMTAQLDITALCNHVVDSLLEATSCYCANVFIANDGEFHWMAGEGGNLDKITIQNLIIKPGHGLVGTSAQQGKPIMAPDVLVDERYIPWEGYPDTRSELVYPVKSNDRVLAVVDLQSNEPAAFDSSDMEAVGVLVDQMAVSLENIKLFEDTRRWAREMEILVQITTDLRAALTRSEVIPIMLESLTKLFQADGAFISLKDILSGEQVVELGRGAWLVLSGRRFSAEKGLIGKVASSGKSYLNNDLSKGKTEELLRPSTGLRAVACMPLITREQVIGTLAVGRNLPISTDEFRILQTIADIVSSAIQRANLFDQTERRLRQVQSLRTIDMAITADMNLRVTLHIILDQVMVQLHVDAADILLFQPDEQVLKYTAGLGFRSRAVPQQTYHWGEGLAGKVAQEKHTISVLDFLGKDAAYSRSDFMAEEGILSYFGVPMVSKGQLMGVLEIFHRSPLNPEYEWQQLMEALSVQAAIAINNSELFEQLQESNQELMQAYDTTLEGWARALELRDRETEGHSRRVTAMTVRLARLMGFSDAQLVHVRRGALLHDIGKMGIPDSILFKPGLLDEKEWETMRLHPIYASQLLAPIAYLQPALEIPFSHHERWDGTGYPQGLKGEAIPLAARIFAIVDVWDALISDRPYQKAWEEQKIRDYIHELSGKQLDPTVVKAFFEMLAQDDQAALKAEVSMAAAKNEERKKPVAE
jgi:PAS domain S-box-containing protein